MAESLRRALAADPERAARRLLGCTLTANGITVRIVEVEAYGGIGEDPGSHAHRGRTARNSAMFEAPGTLYTYFTYGMHWCANVSCRTAGIGSAVLLRGAEVVNGLAAARERRPRSTDRDLARGPARLAKCLGLDGDSNGLDLFDADSPVRLRSAPAIEPALISSGPRTGVSGPGGVTPWRFWVDGARGVSPYRPAVTRSRRAG